MLRKANRLNPETIQRQYSLQQAIKGTTMGVGVTARWWGKGRVPALDVDDSPSMSPLLLSGQRNRVYASPLVEKSAPNQYRNFERIERWAGEYSYLARLPSVLRRQVYL